jgi:hypothetical protein
VVVDVVGGDEGDVTGAGEGDESFEARLVVGAVEATARQRQPASTERVAQARQGFFDRLAFDVVRRQRGQQSVAAVEEILAVTACTRPCPPGACRR